MKIPFFPHKKTIAFSLLAESLQFHNNSVLKEILNKKKILQKMSGRLCVFPHTDYYAKVSWGFFENNFQFFYF